MSTATKTVTFKLDSHHPTPSNDIALPASIQAIISGHFTEDSIYLTGSAIPTGHVSSLFQKASRVWVGNHLIANNPIAWKVRLFDPLIGEAIKSENVEDLASLYCWVAHCREALNSYSEDAPEELFTTLTQIEQRITFCIGSNKQKYLELMVWLNAHSQDNEVKFDSHARGLFCYFLCKQFHQNRSITLEELTNLCVADIRALLIPNGSNSELYLASLITSKAERVFERAEEALQIAFIIKFKEIASHLISNSTLKTILTPHLTSMIDSQTFQDNIGTLARKIINASPFSILN